MPIKAHIVKTMVFPVVKYECESWPVKKRRAPKNSCFWTTVLEKTLESPFNCKEIKPVIPKGKWTLNIHWKDWCWSWSSNTLATRCEEPPHWKRSWCWERLRAGGVEGDDRGWDSWMIPPVQRTWTWANSRRWWGTGRPGELQSMGSQRVWHNLVSEQQERKTRFLVCFLQVASWGWSGRVSLSTRLLIWYLFGTLRLAQSWAHSPFCSWRQQVKTLNLLMEQVSGWISGILTIMLILGLLVPF